MLATGSVMQWFGHFPVSWRTGATFVHDVFALAVFVVVAGHIAFALTHPDSMRSMIKGWVSETWAARHATGWLKEVTGKAAVPGRPPLARKRISGSSGAGALSRSPRSDPSGSGPPTR